MMRKSTEFIMKCNHCNNSIVYKNNPVEYFDNPETEKYPCGARAEFEQELTTIGEWKCPICTMGNAIVTEKIVGEEM